MPCLRSCQRCIFSWCRCLMQQHIEPMPPLDTVQELVDSHIFVEAQKVVDALKAHDCGPALAWCSQHASKLKKIRSHRLEFKLRLQACHCCLIRLFGCIIAGLVLHLGCLVHCCMQNCTKVQLWHLQEFVELVRRQDMAAAIAYARQHLSQWAGPFEADMQRAFAVLVFTADTQCTRYQVRHAAASGRAVKQVYLAWPCYMCSDVATSHSIMQHDATLISRPIVQELFDPVRWTDLQTLFQQDLYRLHSLTFTSLLNIHLQVSLPP